MQALVKVPHMLENGRMGEFRITGDVPAFYIDLTRRLFPKAKEMTDDDDELINIRDSEWFKEAEKKTTPGLSLRALRTLRNMRSGVLAKKIGVRPQQITDMEKGRTPIGKKMAMRLGEALDMDYKHFL